MCGVLGDIKPQFSVIGTEVDKTFSICKSSKESTILISQASYKKVINKVNNFHFEMQEIEIGNVEEKVFTVRKRRGGKKRLGDTRMTMSISAQQNKMRHQQVPAFGV